MGAPGACDARRCSTPATRSRSAGRAASRSWTTRCSSSSTPTSGRSPSRCRTTRPRGAGSSSSTPSTPRSAAAHGELDGGATYRVAERSVVCLRRLPRVRRASRERMSADAELVPTRTSTPTGSVARSPGGPRAVLAAMGLADDERPDDRRSGDGRAARRAAAGARRDRAGGRHLARAHRAALPRDTPHRLPPSDGRRRTRGARSSPARAAATCRRACAHGAGRAAGHDPVAARRGASATSATCASSPHGRAGPAPGSSPSARWARRTPDRRPGAQPLLPEHPSLRQPVSHLGAEELPGAPSSWTSWRRQAGR